MIKYQKKIAIILLVTMFLTVPNQLFFYKKAEAFAPSLAARAAFNVMSKTAIKTFDNPTSIALANAGVGALAIGSYYALEEALGDPQPIADMPDWVKVTVGAGLLATGADLVLDLYNNLKSTNSTTIDIEEPLFSPPNIDGYHSTTEDGSYIKVESNGLRYVNYNGQWKIGYWDVGNGRNGAYISRPLFAKIDGDKISYFLYVTGTSYGDVMTPLIVNTFGSSYHDYVVYDSDLINSSVTQSYPVDLDTVDTSISLAPNIQSLNPSTPIEIVIPAGALDGSMTEAEINSTIVTNQDMIRNRVDDQARIRREVGVPIPNTAFNPDLPYDPVTNPYYIPKTIANPEIPYNPSIPGQGYIANPYFNPSLPIDNVLNPPTIWNPSIPAPSEVPYVYNPAFNPDLPIDISNPIAIPNIIYVEPPPTTNIDIDKIRLPEIIKTKFPFSIPWDIIDFFKLFNQQPQVPKFELDFSSFPGVTDLKYEIDFSQFESLAKIVRYMVLISFTVGLGFLTSRIVRY